MLFSLNCLLQVAIPSVSKFDQVPSPAETASESISEMCALGNKGEVFLGDPSEFTLSLLDATSRKFPGLTCLFGALVPLRKIFPIGLTSRKA